MSGDAQTRVEDYLDDKIQNTADLDQVDSLLQRVEEQQGLLRKQLDEAKNNFIEAQRRFDDRCDQLRARAEAYQRDYTNLNQQIQELAQSNVSDDAAEKVEARMGKVRSLEIAQGYLELVRQTNMLNEQARLNVTQHPRRSVQAYSSMKVLWKHVQDAQVAAEGAAAQLAYMFEQNSKQIYITLKAALEEDLRRTLDQMKWPGKELKFLGGTQEDWQQQVQLLLELQDPDLLGTLESSDFRSRSAAPDPVVLLPLEVMVQPLAVRFRYHFYGDKPTNRLDKPEYFLTHILDLLERHSGFMTDVLGPILDQRVLQSEALETIYTDAVSTFITALLPMVEAKCVSFLPQISQQPQLLSHFFRELLAFDTALRETWFYVPIPRIAAEWKGLTWRLLNAHGYFNTWLTVEKDFALSRYRDIRDAPDSNNIDFDTESGQTKPTKGAIRVNDLLETITDRYRGLSSFSQKMKFLLEIQLSIFDDYHNHLHGALQAYLVSSHAAGRLLQGQTEGEAFGLKGLESLVKVFGSAEFLERKMSDWSDDVFFVELWDELQYRAQSNTGRDASIGTGLRVEELAEKTSMTIRTDAMGEDHDADGSGLFDQTAAAYRKLRERSEEEMLRFFDVNLKAALRPYTKFAQWSSLMDSPADPSTMTPSPSLDSFFQTTGTLVSYLARVLAPGSMRRMVKQYCSVLQREIYDNVLMHHTFSAAGTGQLSRDLSEIRASMEKNSRLSAATGASLKRLEEAVHLLSLDASQPAGNTEEDGWGFNDADDRPPSEVNPGNIVDDRDTKDPSLWEAEMLMFESNEAARKALRDMGLYHLTEGEARNVLKRRVELNGL